MAKETDERSARVEWPLAVFLDTNVLDSLPESLESGELSKLVKQASRVYVPDVVARERVNHRYTKASNGANDAVKARPRISDLRSRFAQEKAFKRRYTVV
ncbi:MAG TPA: hypothetical protein VMZ31_11430 [Phycisphaerae bacterium]|nr:hypothetical protein [Phycisphaerae bacterium]